MIKIGFVDTFDPVPEFFMGWLSGRFDVVRDDESPDILFFGDNNFGYRNLDRKYDNCTRIFYTGENQRPWDYKCHFALSFEHQLHPNHFRLPLYILNIWHYQKMGVILDDTYFESYDNGTEHWGRNDRFAAFVVANPHCKERNEFFHKLNSYRKVDSAGPHLNNMNWLLPRTENGVRDKIRFLSNYKYTICFENSSYPGYVSEKILDAYIAGSIPIYWGSPTVAVDFNTKAFINCHDYDSFDEVVEFIKYLDTDDIHYRAISVASLLDDAFIVETTRKRFLNWFERNVIPKCP